MGRQGGVGVPEIRRKNLLAPDERIDFDHGHMTSVRIGDLTVGYGVCEPGWRWSTHVKPLVATEWCMSRHVGFQLSGRLGLVLQDGTTMEVGPNDVFDVPPGHDAWTIGDEPSIALDWEGLRTWTTPIGVGERTLLTILFTDIVDSTPTAHRLGERAWSDLLARHNEMVRRAIADQRGREVETTGDGFLATFDGAARACRAAVGVRSGARALGLDVRAGIHTGEVDIVGSKVRGIAVHEAARIVAAAVSGEILASSVVRHLVAGSGLSFEDRGERHLKGLDGPRQLFAVVSE
jgi:class 3 adenylate cyclase